MFDTILIYGLGNVICSETFTSTPFTSIKVEFSTLDSSMHLFHALFFQVHKLGRVIAMRDCQLQRFSHDDSIGSIRLNFILDIVEKRSLRIKTMSVCKVSPYFARFDKPKHDKHGSNIRTFVNFHEKRSRLTSQIFANDGEILPIAKSDSRGMFWFLQCCIPVWKIVPRGSISFHRLVYISPVSSSEWHMSHAPTCLSRCIGEKGTDTKVLGNSKDVTVIFCQACAVKYLGQIISWF